MMDWFKSLDDREQKIVSIGAVILILSFVYLVIWEPITTAYDREKQQLERNRTLASLSQQTAAEIKQLRATSQTNRRTIPPQSLLSTLDSSAKQSGLAGSVKQMKPKGKAGVQVKLEKVSFDEMVKWTHTVNSRFGIETTSASIETTDTSGRVNARLTLEIPG